MHTFVVMISLFNMGLLASSDLGIPYQFAERSEANYGPAKQVTMQSLVIVYGTGDVTATSHLTVAV